MTPHGRYIAVETAISVVINGLLSLLAAWFVFRGRESIDAAGPLGYAMDFLPQTFMVTFMSTLVPTWLTRRRVRAGQLQQFPERVARLPRNVVLRALLVGLASTLVLGLTAMILAGWVWNAPLALATLLVLKVACGALLSIPVTRFAITRA